MKKIWLILKNIILDNGLIIYNRDNTPLIAYLHKKKYIIIFVLIFCLLFSFKLTFYLIFTILFFGFLGRFLYKILNLDKKTQKDKKYWFDK